DADEVIEERMKVAKEEIEMMALYDYAVVNDEVPLAVERIKNIIASEHFRVDRVIGKYIKMLKEM
ncbi:TPA: guanylate kinase, partial [Enterococcus faecium]